MKEKKEIHPVIDWEVFCNGRRIDGLGCSRYTKMRGTVKQMTGKRSPKWYCRQHSQQK